jgi:hypothetical protein
MGSALSRGLTMKRLFIIIFVFTTLLPVASAAAQQKARILVGPNVFVSRESDGNMGELPVASDPTNPKNLLGAGIYFRTNHPKGGQETRGYYSHDGGYSWNNIIYPEVVADGGGDPQVAYGRTGTGYFVSLTGHVWGRSAMLFYRSEDGGVVWDKPVYLTYIDHEQIVVDHTTGRFAGNIYMSGMYRPCPEKTDAHVGVYRSSNDGRSWIGLVDVVNNHNMAGRQVQAMNIALFTDGELFVPFVDFPTTDEALKVDERYHYWFATSKDGAATFLPPQKFALQGGGEIKGPNNHFPFFAIDNSDGPFRNRIYIVWADRDYQPGMPDKDQTKTRFWISYSSDRGMSWSKPKMLAPGTLGVGNQFGPQSIAVNNQGTVAVSWYDTCDTPAGHEGVLVNRYLTSSVDGGETFLPAVRVSSASTDPGALAKRLVGAQAHQTSVSFMSGGSSHGEYLGLTADGDGTFHEFWTDGRTGSTQIWTACVRVEQPDKASAEKAKPLLVETDVSKKIEAVLEPLRKFPPAGTVELPIRLKNVSDKPIYGPITVEVTELKPDGALLNAEDNGSGVGATFDYSRALGDFESLLPGAISEGIVWRFKAPAKPSDFPHLKFKVTARVEQTNSADQAK